MITDKYLKDNGFTMRFASDSMVYFFKGDVKLEKIYKGYLSYDPYVKVETKDELEDLLNYIAVNGKKNS